MANQVFLLQQINCIYDITAQNKNISSNSKKIAQNIQRNGKQTFKQTPYAVINIGKLSQKTLSIQKGGKRPTWNQAFLFNTKQTKGKVTIFDQDGTSSQLIGLGDFDISLIDQQLGQFAIQILFEEKVIGKVFMRVLAKYKQTQQNSEKLQGNQQFQKKLNFLFLQKLVNSNKNNTNILPQDSINTKIMSNELSKLPQINSTNNRSTNNNQNLQIFQPANHSNWQSIAPTNPTNQYNQRNIPFLNNPNPPNPGINYMNYQNQILFQQNINPPLNSLNLPMIPQNNYINTPYVHQPIQSKNVFYIYQSKQSLTNPVYQCIDIKKYNQNMCKNSNSPLPKVINKKINKQPSIFSEISNLF